MPDQIITITIPSEKVATALQGFLKIYPNPGGYTNAQWVKEKVRRIVVGDIRRGLQMLADENNVVAEDNTIVQ